MRVILIIIILVIITSCSKNEDRIFYSYKGVTITRINNNDNIYLYYGKIKDNRFPKAYVKVECGNVDNMLGGYIIFHSNKKVEVVNELGKFTMMKKDSLLYLSDYSAYWWPWQLENRNDIKLDSICEFFNIIKLEKSINENLRSKVTVEYSSN